MDNIKSVSCYTQYIHQKIDPLLNTYKKRPYKPRVLRQMPPEVDNLLGVA